MSAKTMTSTFTKRTDCLIKSYKHYTFVDTSAWYALFDKDDNNHAQANHFYENNAFPLVTTDYILDEALP